MSAVDKAIAIVGTQQALADLVGVSSMAVSKWRRHRVPAERCRAIERATNGEVTAHDLRPDIFGPADQAAA